MSNRRPLIVDLLEPRRLFAGFNTSLHNGDGTTVGGYPAEIVRAGSHWYAALGTSGAIDSPRSIWVGDVGADGEYGQPRLLLAGMTGASAYDLRAVGDRLLFTRGGRLYLTDADGTQANAFGPTFASPPSELTVADGGATPSIYFAAGLIANDTELWHSDGSDAGTARVVDIVPGNAGSAPQNLTVAADGRLFFTAFTAAAGRELWVSNGLPGSTSLVKDFRGAQSSSFGVIYPYGTNKVIYTVGGSLYTSDGTEASTGIVQSTWYGLAAKLWRVTGGFVYYSTLITPLHFAFYGDNGSFKDLGPLDVAVGGYSGLNASDGKRLFLFAGSASIAQRGVYAIDGNGIQYVGGGPNVRGIAAAGDGKGVYIDYLDAVGGTHYLEYTSEPGQQPISIMTRPDADFPLPLFAEGRHLFISVNDTSSGGRRLYYSTWDATPPNLVSADLDRDASPHALRLTLSEPNTNTSWTVSFALSVRRLSDNYTFQPGSFTLQSNVGNVMTFAANPSVIPDGRLTDGLYEATLAAFTVTDAANNTPSTPFVFQFAFLTGDFNGDRTVNFTDLLTLAKNYGQSGKTFSGGNADYSADGKVDFDDLLLLAKHYNQSLPMTAANSAAAIASTVADDRTSSSRRRSSAASLIV